jgi:hypothetical protein
MRASLKEPRTLAEVESRILEKYESLFKRDEFSSGNNQVQQASTRVLVNSKGLEFQLVELFEECKSISRKIEELASDISNCKDSSSFEIEKLEQRIKLSSIKKENNQSKAYFISLSNNDEDYFDLETQEFSSFLIKGVNGFLTLEVNSEVERPKVASIETSLGGIGLLSEAELSNYLPSEVLVKSSDTKKVVYTLNPDLIKQFSTRIILDKPSQVNFLKLNSFLIQDFSDTTSYSLNVKFKLNGKLTAEQTVALSSRSTLYAVDSVICNEVLITGGRGFITSQPYTVTLKERLPSMPDSEARSLFLIEENESKLNCYMVAGGLDLISLGCGEKNNGAIGIIESNILTGTNSFMIEGDVPSENGTYIDCIYEEIEVDGTISYRERFPIASILDDGLIREYLTLVDTTPSFYFYRPSLKIKNFITATTDFEVTKNGGSTWTPIGSGIVDDFTLLRINRPLTREETLITYDVDYRVPVDIKNKISIDGYRSFSVTSDVPYRIKVAIKTKPGSIGSQVRMNEIYLLVK